MNERLNNIAKNIKMLREKFGLSQDQLANKLNISSQAVSKWETGKSCPSIEILIELSKIFYVSIDALITSLNICDGVDASAKNINFRLKQVWLKHNQNESVYEDVNSIAASIMPLHPNEKERFWIDSARTIIKGTIHAMLEDNNIDYERFDLQKIKDILQFTNLDRDDKRKKIAEYFEDKSDQCKEMMGVYLTTADGTANSFMSFVLVFLNKITD